MTWSCPLSAALSVALAFSVAFSVALSVSFVLPLPFPLPLDLPLPVVFVLSSSSDTVFSASASSCCKYARRWGWTTTHTITKVVTYRSAMDSNRRTRTYQEDIIVLTQHVDHRVVFEAQVEIRIVERRGPLAQLCLLCTVGRLRNESVRGIVVDPYDSTI